MFTEEFGKCIIAKANFQLKENMHPVFKPKCCMPFALWNALTKDLTD